MKYYAILKNKSGCDYGEPIIIEASTDTIAKRLVAKKLSNDDGWIVELYRGLVEINSMPIAVRYDRTWSNR